MWWIIRDWFLDSVTVPLLDKSVYWLGRLKIRAVSRGMLRELEREKIMAVIYADNADDIEWANDPDDHNEDPDSDEEWGIYGDNPY